MQESIRKVNITQRFLAVALAVSLSVSAFCSTKAKAITLETIAVAVTIGELVYRVGRLGLDCWNLYQDLSSPDDFNSAYSSYVSTLDSTTASSFVAVTGFSVGSTSQFSYVRKALKNWVKSSATNTTKLFFNLGVNDKVFVFGETSSFLYGAYWDDTGKLVVGKFTNPRGAVSPLWLGVFSLSDLELLEVGGFSNWQYCTSISDLYYSAVYAHRAPNFDTTTVAYFDPSREFIMYDYDNYPCFPCVVSYSGSVEFTANSYAGVSLAFGDGCYSASSSSTISWDNSRIVVAPSGADSFTRTASLMQTINNYNIDNSYTDNSTTVNYFIGSLADDGSVSDIYAPNLFDEDTMIFTDPETGTEYQAAGWLYNYETRTYGIAFDSGVLTVNDTGVDYVRLTYGDNAVTVEYFQGDAETLVSSSSYAYVMASQSACNINGHTYTYETVKEPTCTVPGERKYTCSVCGDEYAEEIPTVGHSYEYSIYQAPTCTAAGIGLYTCSTCGDQYTEPIVSTGHTPELIEYVPTVYDDNGIVVSTGYSVYRCSVCGAEYTVPDEIPMESEGWFDGFASAIKSFGKAAFSAIGSGLSKVFSGFTDLIGGIFGFLSDTVLGGVKNFFSSFSDSSILDIFQQENEDGSTTTTLPEGMSGAMATVGGFITGLPSELLGVLVFGIALLLLLAALKLLL